MGKKKDEPQPPDELEERMTAQDHLDAVKKAHEDTPPGAPRRDRMREPSRREEKS